MVEFNPQDMLWCPSGAKDRHGAAPIQVVMHPAMTGIVEGRNITWIKKDTGEQ